MNHCLNNFLFLTIMVYVNRKKFYDNYRKYFGRLNQKQVNGLNFLLDKLEDSKELTYIPHIAYIFATIYLETAKTFQPITEYGRKSYFRKYNGRYGNGPNDGYKYRGRGFVQITFKDNYYRAGRNLSKKYGRKIDLVSFPNKALVPKYAFDIIVLGMLGGLFTDKKLGKYINKRKKDYYNARRVVNGTDRANRIANYAKNFEKIFNISKIERLKLITPRISRISERTTLSSKRIFLTRKNMLEMELF